MNQPVSPERKALLQIGAQHPAWDSDPDNVLVRLFNDVTRLARTAVGAEGANDDKKADWCSDQLSPPEPDEDEPEPDDSEPEEEAKLLDFDAWRLPGKAEGAASAGRRLAPKRGELRAVERTDQMKLVYKDTGHEVLVGDPAVLEGVECVVTRWTTRSGLFDGRVTVQHANGMWREVQPYQLGLCWVDVNADLSTPRDRWPPKVIMESTPTGENPHEAFKRQHLTRYEVPTHPLDGEPDHRLPAQRVAFNATDYIGFSEEQIAMIRRGFMAALDQCWELEKQERNFK